MAHAPKRPQAPPRKPARLVAPKEFAQYWGVTVNTVHRWVAKGAVIPERTPGGGLRFRIHD